MITDDAPLQWLYQMMETNLHLTWWYLARQPYSFSIKYRKGWLHNNVEFFSWQAMNTYLEKATLEGRPLGLFLCIT